MRNIAGILRIRTHYVLTFGLHLAKQLIINQSESSVIHLEYNSPTTVSIDQIRIASIEWEGVDEIDSEVFETNIICSVSTPDGLFLVILDNAEEPGLIELWGENGPRVIQ
jgi:hypothetical protein